VVHAACEQTLCERRDAEISGPFIGATAADAAPLARWRARTTEKLREMPRPPPVTIKPAGCRNKVFSASSSVVFSLN